VYTKNEFGDWYKVRVKFDRYVTEKQYSAVTNSRTALPETRVDFGVLAEETEGSSNKY